MSLAVGFDNIAKQFGPVRVLHGKARPRVGLLSNGEEAVKGTELTRGAHRLLSSEAVQKDFEYVGYVEGKDIFAGPLPWD